jgi:CHAD domain-containing protein
MWLKTEAKAMADALGVARDMDVFLMDLMEPVITESAHDADLAVLLRASRDARNATHAAAAAALMSKRHQRFVTRLNTWLGGRGWRANDHAKGDGAAQDFARDMLNARLAKLAARAKTIKQMSAAELHALRIAVKKLRYGLEFFQSLLPPKRTVRIGRVLKDLQDALGYMNDLDVAQRTLRRLTAAATTTAARAAIGRAGRRVTDAFETNVKSTRPQAARAATRLRACKTL